MFRHVRISSKKCLLDLLCFPSVCLSVRIYQRGFHCRIFLNVIFGTLTKICLETRYQFKFRQQYKGTLHKDLSAFILLTVVGKYFVYQQYCKRNRFLRFHGNNQRFILFTAACGSTTVQRKCTVAFACQQ